MYLHIANCTRQNQRVFYRLDFNFEGNPISQLGVLPKHHDIKPGRQEPVGGDLKHISQAQSIIDQLQRYGLTDAAEANRVKGFIPYIYSVGKPIPAATIEKVINSNLGVLTRQGEVLREKAAITASTVVESDNVTIGFEQVSESEYGGPSVAEGFIVDKTAPAPDPKGGRGHRGSRLDKKAA